MSKLSAGEIIETLKQYTILEINELVKAIETEFNISANFSVAAPTSDSGAKEDAQSEFALHLTNAGANKIAVIKVIREITGIGLMEAKKMVDSTPSLVKDVVPAEEVETLKKKFTEAGATVEFK
ncbi:50S ribosomal protein L7/L12 [Candidatus Mycoplasma haematohominis]|uniref:Large ribosomal subunit protein bL12 n=1 Tax=Candidatus Mycoplasma haematohominis TaxID=1494318 RepID=A0A478FVC6_9MOLU|nr:50S ribosomal protein L7/L12 [Candidatus Mycoplasma haemohominis]